jgi:hypothetical protein
VKGECGGDGESEGPDHWIDAVSTRAPGGGPDGENMSSVGDMLQHLSVDVCAWQLPTGLDTACSAVRRCNVPCVACHGVHHTLQRLQPWSAGAAENCFADSCAGSCAVAFNSVCCSDLYVWQFKLWGLGISRTLPPASTS